MSDLLQSALKLGRNKNIAREEYSVAMGKKEPAAFAAMPSQIELSDLREDTEVQIQLAITRNGYMEIEAYCPDDFISLPRRVITTDVFPGGTFDFTVRIVTSKLHQGRNYSSITFSTAAEEIRVDVTVDVPVKPILDDYNPKQLLLDLSQVYFSFRKGMMDSSEWAKQSLQLIGSINGTDRFSQFLMLFKAQLHIETEEYVDAANLLEYMADLIQRMPESDTAMNSYFSYVRALYEHDRKRSDDLCLRIREAYHREPCWQILWILFQLDPQYDESPGLKLDDISAEFYDGCSSPFLFFEALEIFLQYPGFFSDASEFELQVLNLGLKLNCLTPAMSARVTEVFLLQTEQQLAEKNTEFAIRILKAIYQLYPTRDLLKAVCRLLILTEDLSPEAGAYFALAVKEYIDDIPGIFLAFLRTREAGRYDLLPARVIDAFAESTESLKEYRRYFFANIIANKEKRPESYMRFETLFREYAEKQLMVGAADPNLAVIYRDLIESGKLTPGMRSRLFEVLSVREISCSNERMRNVMVFHDELNVYQDVPLKEGKARVKVYSRDAVILFKDITGNIYANIDYQKTEYLPTDEFIDICVKGVPINDYMLMKDTMPLLRGYKDPVEILNYMTTRMNTDSFRSGYVKKLINDTVLYFSRNLRESNVYDELLAFFKYDLAPETQGKLIEVMIERTLYRDAYEMIRKKGFDHLSEESVAKLSSALVEILNYREDGLLLAMCEQSFRKTTFDPRIYKYMVKNYNGELEVLLAMYRAGRAYGEDYSNLPERILRRAIESHEDADLIPQIFAKYYTEGSDAELKKDYMNYKAARYLYNGDSGDTDFFKYIENDLMRGEKFSTPAMVGYLKYMSDKDISGKRRLQMIEMQLKALTGRSIMLEEFKNYSRYFRLPAALSNSVIINRFGQNSQVIYEIYFKDQVVHKEEQMAEIFEGCFAKYITLFYGESVVYSVDNGEPVQVSYEDLNIIRDESRYSELNNIIQMKETGNMLALNLEAKEYFVKDKLIERLF